ncbi:hypothetical protein GCM10008022_28030 [Paenibacillus hunanensis]|nr:hypothetical protein GCM10008022_28030 [Paenibacillus hunanensis]
MKLNTGKIDKSSFPFKDNEGGATFYVGWKYIRKGQLLSLFQLGDRISYTYCNETVI